jgi:hypothetical protein
MWTTANRPKYNRDKLRYPSDLTGEEWAHIEALIPAANTATEACSLSRPWYPFLQKLFADGG